MLFNVQSLSKKYKHTHALQDICMQIEKGDVYGIIGQSGAGKSTLIRCLAGLVSPSAGHILFQGEDLASLDKHSLRTARKKMGMIFQHFNLLSSRTVAKNIAYPLEIAGMPQEERVEELLRLVGLEEKKNAYPAQLSGGEKQRVGIARALAHYPEVLLCDEATSALDPKTTREILDLLHAINKKLNVTIVLITHEMEVIKRICNKVAVIDKGSIVEAGPVADVFWDPKHTITKHFLQHHSLPERISSCERTLLRLRFKGKAAKEPLISQIVKNFHVEANILSGWIDTLQTGVIGTLLIELTGPSAHIHDALHFLSGQDVSYEVLHDT
jgi:D-methionine transport system ATP-binding protein